MSQSPVQVKDLSRTFGATVALENVSLEIPQGCVFGLVGENGAGKTTLIRHLLGLLRPTQGSVAVFGHNPVQRPVDVLSQVGYLSEDRELPEWMSVEELMHFTAAFYPAWDQAYADALAEQFQLQPMQKVRSLSRGQLARAGLLLALAHRPALLLLDEPSSGLDPVVRRDILTAIIRTVADEGRTVLFSSHLLEEVQRVADRVAMLHRGKVLLSDTLDDILASHFRITVNFAEPLVAAPQLPGVISCDGEGREWTLYCNGQRDTLAQHLSEKQIRIVDQGTPTLEEIFVARSRPVHATTSAGALS